MTKASKADVDAATALAKKIACTSEYINHGGFIPTVAEAFAEVRQQGHDEGLEEAALKHEGWATKAKDRADKAPNRWHAAFDLTERGVHEASANDIRALKGKPAAR